MFRPVSYTHLDVYKRQNSTSPKKFPLLFANNWSLHSRNARLCSDKNTVIAIRRSKTFSSDLPLFLPIFQLHYQHPFDNEYFFRHQPICCNMCSAHLKFHDLLNNPLNFSSC